MKERFEFTLDLCIVTQRCANKLTSLKERRMERPFTFSKPISTKLKMTMMKSKQLHLSCKYLYRPSASTFNPASTVNIAVKTWKPKIITAVNHFCFEKCILLFLFSNNSSNKNTYKRQKWLEKMSKFASELT